MYEKFASWEDVISAVRRGDYLSYHAPLDHKPTPVHCELRARNKIRVFPPGSDADPFTADKGHLDRFRTRVRA